MVVNPTLRARALVLRVLLALSVMSAGLVSASGLGSGPAVAGKQHKNPRTFTQSAPIVGPVGVTGAMNPYPSIIQVNGMKGRITDVNATLSEIAHSWPDDIQVLLVGPQGQSTMLMSGVGGGSSTVVSGVTLVFDDQAGRLASNEDRLQSGKFAPTSFAVRALPPGPPDGAGTGIVALAAFDGIKPNGEWRLYVADTGNAGYDGDIAKGWKLTIKTDARKKRR